jgi:heme-degrading monooxygenase HmoA
MTSYKALHLSIFSCSDQKLASDLLQTLCSIKGTSNIGLYKKSTQQTERSQNDWSCEILHFFESLEDLEKFLSQSANIYSELKKNSTVWVQDAAILTKDMIKQPTISNDVIMTVAFDVPPDKEATVTEDWYVAVPYVSSGKGYRRAAMFRSILGKNCHHQYYNIAVWESVQAWHDVVSTEESRKVHAAQGHMKRTLYIAELAEEETAL